MKKFEDKLEGQTNDKSISGPGRIRTDDHPVMSRVLHQAKLLAQLLWNVRGNNG